MIKDRYQQERETFRKTFSFLQHHPIAIYGIGRRTATLLPVIHDFHVVGLLDRQKNNFGKVIDGYPVCSLDSIKGKVVAIIISADPSNWQTIYRRIARECDLPVYYLNGEQAVADATEYEDNPYWRVKEEDLRSAIEMHEVISFDFFDTLMTRKVFASSDVFSLLAQRVQDIIGSKLDFATWRQRIAAQCPPEADLEYLYIQLVNKVGLPKENAKLLAEREFHLESDLCVPRMPVIRALRRAKQLGKIVYIVSDTYFTKKQISALLGRMSIDFPEDHLLLSCEVGESKAAGGLFDFLRALEPGRSILHIGDNQQSDIVQAQAHGVDAFFIMRPADMLQASSMGAVVDQSQTLADEVVLGLLSARLFADPFALHVTQGKVNFQQAVDYGYAVYGGMLTRYAEWIYAQVEARKLDCLLFFARDGYFLQRDFQCLCQVRNLPRQVTSCYVPISRQLIFIATMHTEEDLRRVASFPFIGTFRDYLHERFNVAADDTDAHSGVMINAASEYETLKEWLKPYITRIWEEQSRQEQQYRKYLIKNVLPHVTAHAATVDFSFYGTTQYYFQQFTDRKFPGFYMLANLTKENRFCQFSEMLACFQSDDDPGAQHNKLYKRETFMESLLTAPYGMIRYIDATGHIVYEPDKQNQRHFAVKERVHDGALEFMRDYAALIPFDGRSGAESMELECFYVLLNGGCKLSTNILHGFYYDNDIVGSAEVPLEV